MTVSRFAKIFYWLLLAGQLGVTLLLVYSFTSNNIHVEMNIEKQSYLVIIMLFLLMFGIVFSKVINAKQLQKVKKIEKKEDQLKKYNASLILKYLLIALPGYIGIYFYSISDNIPIIGFASILFFLLFVERPSKKTLIRDFFG